MTLQEYRRRRRFHLSCLLHFRSRQLRQTQASLRRRRPLLHHQTIHLWRHQHLTLRLESHLRLPEKIRRPCQPTALHYRSRQLRQMQASHHHRRPLLHHQTIHLW